MPMEYRVTIELLNSDGVEHVLAEEVLLSDCDEFGEADDGFIGDMEHALDNMRDEALELLDG